MANEIAEAFVYVMWQYYLFWLLQGLAGLALAVTIFVGFLYGAAKVWVFINSDKGH